MSPHGRLGLASLTIAVLLGPALPSMGSPNWGTSSCYPVDTVPPDLQNLTMTPDSFDVRDGAKTVTVTVHATDSSAPGRAVSGVSVITVDLQDLAAQRGLNRVRGALHRSSGGATDGTWTATLTIPRWSAGGANGQEWTLVSVVAVDVAGNSRIWSRTAGPDDLRSTSWASGMTVVSTPDVTPPDLRAWSFTPHSVDTRQSARTVVVTARLHDAQSGVAGARVTFTRTHGLSRTAGARLHRVSGTAALGTWRGTVTIRRWSGTDGWTAAVRANDRADNRLRVGPGDLRAHGWSSRLSVVSASDTTRPRLLKLGFPTTVDVRTSDRKLTVTATVDDAQSSVARVQALFERAYVGGDHYTIYVNDMRRVSGTARHGVWRGTVVVPRCEPWRSLHQPTTGTYVAAVSATDRAGNTRSLVGDRIGDIGPHSLHLIATTRDLAQPGVATLAPTTTTGPVVVSFFRDVTDVRTTNAELVDLADSTPVTFDAVTCQDANGVVVDCVTGLVRTTSFSLSSPLTSGHSYGLFFNQDGTNLQLTNRHGVPAAWNEALAVVTPS